MSVNLSASLPLPVDAEPRAAAHSGYRADIDGLRALAVLPVVFYHTGVRGFSGGFVGVDVFFVISGFLITGVLLRDVDGDRFTVGGFYRRRILRIFPALFTMMAVATALACFTMLPTEVERFSRSLATTALFASNIQFYLESDYFGLASSVKPLLHTWSLAVEEQWYIVWPLLIGWLGVQRRARLLPVAVTITLTSLIFSAWQTSSDSAGAFYLLPARAWELGLGALLAICPRRTANRWLLELAGIAGVLLILFATKFYTHETRFPGLAALAPCIGAALLIYSGAEQTRASRLLSIPVVLFVGRISYSLYLWHWPVIVFSQIGLLWPQSPAVIVAQIALSLLLATLSWRFVEMRFRGNRSWSNSQVLWIGAAAMLAASGIAALVPRLSGALMSFDGRQAEMARYLDMDGDALYRRGTCFAVGPRSPFDAAGCLAHRTGKPAILFAGDSHAAALWPGLSRHADRFDLLQATATGCVAKLYERPEKSRCAEVINAGLRDALPREQPQATLLTARWTWRTLDGLEKTLEDPVVRAGHPILIGPVPEYVAALPRILVFAERRGDDSLVARSLDPDVWSIDKTLRDMARRTHTPYISLLEILCPADRCITQTPSGAPLQFDSGHLTPAGSAFVVDALLPRIDRLAGQQP